MSEFDYPTECVRKYAHTVEGTGEHHEFSVRIEGYDAPAIAAIVDQTADPLLEALRVEKEPGVFTSVPGSLEIVRSRIIRALKDAGCSVTQWSHVIEVKTNRRPEHRVFVPTLDPA